MLITLNLLSAEQKQILKSRRLTLLTAKTASILLTAVIIATALAGAAEFMMRKTWEKIQATAYAGSTEFNATIKNVNYLAALLETADAGHHRWSAALAELALSAPPGVTLSAIRLDSATGTLSVQGVARERADLLQLQARLRQSSLFSDAAIPLQDLSEKTNSSFTLTAVVNAQNL